MSSNIFLLRRSAAFLIDVACAGLPLLLVAPVAISFWSSGGDGQLAAEIMVTANFVLAVGIFYLMQLTQMLRGRQTPGRLLLHLEIVSAGEEGQVPWRFVLLRETASFALVALALYLHLYPLLFVPALWALFDKKGRSLFDLLARTRVQDTIIAVEEA